MADSMIFYKSFRDAIKLCKPEDAIKVIEVILDYGLDGIEPEDMDGVAGVAFALIKPQIDANNKRREDGQKGAQFGSLGGRPKKGAKEEEKTPMGLSDENTETPMGLSDEEVKTPRGLSSEETETPNVNVNDNENVNENVKKREGAPRFSPPSVEEVLEYCQERGNGVDPAAFVDFYESKGWKIGKERMRDWKAAVRTWERRDETARSGTKKPEQFPQRGYDFDELEKQLVKNL